MMILHFHFAFNSNMSVWKLVAEYFHVQKSNFLRKNTYNKVLLQWNHNYFSNCQPKFWRRANSILIISFRKIIYV